ncbi:hypothetical protein DK926_18870 [Rhodococcus sp. Eu-32]|uniref:hypothetical protein n=1 Tax=Rhodococcus sp. Eu-32 TaxID=1017319 RepID=UPI000DF38181|nr:hypothetical protein [Rhodococcus sp. Eu-32]RRQ26308.1 hypothetical protein DK926_18870 [Rhodococcus sp. Eu-32]
MEELGSQTVRVVVRQLGKRGVHTEVTAAEYPGCSVQPISSTEGVPLERSEQWTIFAPVGFPESTENVLAVDGIGDRLHVDGDLQTWFDEDGIADHVWGTLTKWNGGVANG